MENFPIDVLRIILSLLTKESILPCKIVCKTWRVLLDEADIKVGLLFLFTRRFWDQLELYYGDNHASGDKTVLRKLQRVVELTTGNGDWVMVGSCNGLVCFGQLDAKKYVSFVCNPITGESIHIEGLKNGFRIYGFGYVRSTNEYKVVGMDSEYIYVYTLGTCGWRLIGKKISRLLSTGNAMGAFANGALHWFHWIYRKGSGQQLKIVAFDLAEEKFRPVLSPPPSPVTDYHSRHLNVEANLSFLGGHLCCVHMEVEFKYLHIWMFKKGMRNNAKYGDIPKKDQRGCYYNKTWSWSKFSCISWNDDSKLYTPISITKSNTILLWESSMGHLCSYDPTTSTIKKLWDSSYRKGSSVQIIPHMNTFVSLKDMISENV